MGPISICQSSLHAWKSHLPPPTDQGGVLYRSAPAQAPPRPAFPRPVQVPTRDDAAARPLSLCILYSCSSESGEHSRILQLLQLIGSRTEAFYALNSALQICSLGIVTRKMHWDNDTSQVGKIDSHLFAVFAALWYIFSCLLCPSNSGRLRWTRPPCSSVQGRIMFPVPIQVTPPD